MATKNCEGPRTHPCLTPDVVSNLFDSFRSGTNCTKYIVVSISVSYSVIYLKIDTYNQIEAYRKEGAV